MVDGKKKRKLKNRRIKTEEEEKFQQRFTK
jgi:hypothetical protein